MTADDRLERFRDYLTSKGLKLTQARGTVARLVLASPTPVDVEQLGEALRDSADPISRATVYRTVEQLSEAGLIER